MICVSAHARVCLSSAPCPWVSLLCLNLLCNGTGAYVHEDSHSYLGSSILIPKDGPVRPAWLGWHAGMLGMPTGKLRWQKYGEQWTHDSSEVAWPAVTVSPRSVELTSSSFRCDLDTFQNHFLSPIHNLSQGELALVVP